MDYYNRFQEKQNFINIKLNEIMQAYNESSHKNEFEIKIVDQKNSFNKIVYVTILKEKEYKFTFHPDINIKRLEKRFRELANLILI